MSSYFFQGQPNRVFRRFWQPRLSLKIFSGFVVIALLAAFCLPGDLQAATVTKRWGENSNCDYTGVSQDTYIDQSKKIRNMGATTLIRIGDNSGWRAVRTLIKFDFSNIGIASSDQIISARLYLKNYDIPDPSAASTYGVEIWRIKRDWYEGNNDYADANDADDEVTWDYVDYNDILWDQGGIYESNDCAATRDDVIYITNVGQFHSWDVTDSVKYMFDNNQYYGWMLRWKGEDLGITNAMRFHSKENGTASKRPYLEITYDDSAAAPLDVNPTSMNIFVGDNLDAVISGGTAPYSVTSTNSSVAGAVINGTTATVTGQAAGTATIHVTDIDGSSVDISVTVTEPLAVAPTNVSLYPSQSTTVTVSGGTPGYTVTSGNVVVAQATISGNTVTITAVGTGSVTVTITDLADKHVYVTVNVSQSMTPGLGDCPVPPFTTATVGPSVMIMFDTSGSMKTDDEGDGKDRFAEAREAILATLAANPNIRFGLARMDGTPWDSYTRPGGLNTKHNLLKGGRILVPAGYTGTFATSAEYITWYIENYMKTIDQMRADYGARHWTNLAETLLDIGRYFATVIDGSGNRVGKGPAGLGYYKEGIDYTAKYDKDNDGTYEPYQASLHDDVGNPIDTTSPMQYSCEQAFVIMFTDGLATVDNGWDLLPTLIGDYDGDGESTDCPRADPEVIRPGISDPNNSQYGRPVAGTPIGQYPCDTREDPSEDNEPGAATYLDDVAKWLYDKDLRSDIPGTQNIITYVVAFHTSGDLLANAAAQGGGQYFTPTSLDELTTSLQQAMEDILLKVASGTAVSAVTTSAQTDDFMFRAKFMPGTAWKGYLERFTLPHTDSDDADWEAGALLNSRVTANGHGDRKIYTFISGQNPDKQAFVNTDGAVKTQMMNLWGLTGDPDEAGDIIDYIRGDSTYDGGKYKDRGGWLLGDIDYSSPATVSPPKGWYFNRVLYNDPPEYASYPAFKGANSARKYMTYVGANDGMLHAFDSQTGQEEWAFIPESIQGKLKDLTVADCHKYFVDLTPFVADAWFGTDAADVDESDGHNWKTVLIGGNRFGGEEYFALDVTDPAHDQFDALWDVIPFAGQMSSNVPAVGKVKANGGAVDSWAAIVTSGYHETTDAGKIAALDIKDGQALTIWKTGANWYDDRDAQAKEAHIAGSSYYTLTPPAVLDSDLDGYLDLIFVGDTEGTLWKYYYDYVEDGWKRVELFNTGGQAITAKPALAFDADHNLRIYFGTGKYLEESDKANNTRNAFYCLVEKPYDDGIPNNDNANERHFTGTESFTGQLQDLTDTITWEQFDNDLDAAAQAKATGIGWYFNLDLPAVGGDPAERVLNKALVVAGKVFFSSFFPNQDVCGFGGHARLYAIDYIYGVVEDDMVLEDMVAGKRYKETGLGIASEPVYYFDPVNKTISVLTQTGDAKDHRDDPDLDEREMELKSWNSKW